MSRLHAFTDDALADHDAVALSERLRQGEISSKELVEASRERLQRVAALHAVQIECEPRGTDGRFAGVPTYLKDNVDLAGVPTGNGSEAYAARPAKRDDPYVAQFLSTGLTVLGKTRMPEFGFNASTEFRTAEPVRNPWHTDYSVGASSGGAAALVAAGVVPIAHANDGGGSIRIPAAAAGLVGLKPTRNRHIDAAPYKALPIKIVSEGVLTRSVRDTAAFHAAMEQTWRHAHLDAIGLVEGPSDRRMRIGLITETVNGAVVDAQTRASVDDIAAVLEAHGHVLEPVAPPVTKQFAHDFELLWSLTAAAATTAGPLMFGRGFDTRRCDGLTLGLRRHFRTHLLKVPGAVLRLRRAEAQYRTALAGYDAVLSPVLAHVTPRLGHLSPNVPFDTLMARLNAYVAFTPLNNIVGAPGLSMPVGLSAEGLPLSVQLSGPRGAERTLLELGYLIEAERPRPRISLT